MPQYMFRNAAPEFVPVVLASTTGLRLFPMTSSKYPKHLLPVAGIPVIIGLLQNIQSCGFQECVVVIAPDDMVSIPFLKQSLHGYEVVSSKANLVLESANKDNAMKITVVQLVDDCPGSVDAIRQVEKANVIPKNSHIVVVPGDLVLLNTNALRKLADAHRYGYASEEVSAACTVMLKDVGEQDEHGVPLKESAKQKKGGVARDEEEIEYMGLLFASKDTSATARLIWKQSKIDVEEDEDMVGTTPKLVLPKPRLRQGITRVRNDWVDQHVYFFAPWVRRLMVSKKKLMSIQNDLLPLLISRQYQGVLATFDSQVEKEVKEEILKDHFGSRDGLEPTDDGHGQTCMGNQLKRSTHEYTVLAQVHNEAIRAHTIASYLYACKEIVSRAVDPESSNNPCLKLPKGTTVKAKFHSILLPETTTGDKVNLKSSTVGRQCKLGAKCRLNNVVIMDNVTIGDNVILQNSVIGAGCTIGDNCNLNDCQVGTKKEIPSGTKEKGESFLQDSMED